MTAHPDDGDVYSPAEDSDLLLEAAADVVRPGWRVVETGVGSGYVAAGLAARVDVEVVGVDINPHACRASVDRGLEVVRGSLLDPIADGSVDAAIFNPPYLPSDGRLASSWAERAVDGGPTGVEVILAWIRDLPRVLRRDGLAVCVVSSLGDVDRVEATARRCGFAVSERGATRLPHERLAALEFAPPD